jgi:hypothetical protein
LVDTRRVGLRQGAPITIAGDYVIAGAGVQVPGPLRHLIIAYKLGANGKLPTSVH